MADRSTQHGRRIDEAMEAEVEGLIRGAPVDARAREDLEQEPTEHDTVPLPDPADETEHREVLERSDLARFLRPSSFPADVDTLLAVAREEYAPDEVIEQLEALPRERVYAVFGEVWAALGHESEHRAEAEPEGAEPRLPEPSVPEPVPERAVAEAVYEGAPPPAAMPPEAEPADALSIAGVVVGVARGAVHLAIDVLTFVPRKLLR
jgi:hypothetical protein